MANRYANAIVAQGGASNPYRVASALIEAMNEVRAEGGGTVAICEDVAVRMIAHQFGWLLGTPRLDRDQEAYSLTYADLEEKAHD